MSLAYHINLEIYLNLSYGITRLWKPRLLHLEVLFNGFNSTTYLNENDTKLIQIYLGVSLSIPLYQWDNTKRNPCVVYSHCPTNDSTTYVYIAAAYLAIMLLSLLAYCRG